MVFEFNGKFNSKEDTKVHLKNGAKKYVSPMYTPVIGPIKTGYDAYSTLL